SEALIAMRLAFHEACAVGVLDEGEARTAIDRAAGLHYPLRTYRRVVASLALSPEREARLLRFLEREATDLKAEDARELLRRIAGDETPLPSRLRTPRRPWRSAAYRLGPRPGLPETGPTLSQLPPAPKVPGWTSVRTVTAAETNAKLMRLRHRYGVTRVADITGLDTLGIPCFSAILPGSLAGSGISAYSGKALDPMEARVGAQMEALEGALVRDDRVPMRRASYVDLAREVHTLDPERLQIVGTEHRDLRQLELDWIPGWNLRSGETTWVPADTVFFRPGPNPPWHLTSNGQAAGNCLTEALAHALAEAIERDAETLYRVATGYAHVPYTLRLLAGPARTACPPEHVRRPAPWYPFVDLETLPEPLRAILCQMRQAGAGIDLRWIASEVPVAAFLCLIQERHGPEAMLHAGAGAHPDAAVAARRAITEAAQSRVTYIHGVREDLRNAALRPQEVPGGGWFDPTTDRVNFATLPRHAFDDVVDDLHWMMDGLERAGLDEVLVVDLSHPAIPFSVVRVIVPGLEAPLDFRDRDRVALGWRARRLLDASAWTDDRT
ncbi:MAG: YcaO-like family protein, partial [Dehalococcoidia bacterium]